MTTAWPVGTRGAAIERIAPWVAVGALAIALWDPALSRDQAAFDHLVVLDITQSMAVADVPAARVPPPVAVAGQGGGAAAQLAAEDDASPDSITRLEAARRSVQAMLPDLPCGSRVAIGMFTEYRTLLLTAPVEVCANLDALRTIVARVDHPLAWSGNSEVAKALHSAVKTARELPSHPSIVFYTDGQEAPPLHPAFRPALEGPAATGVLVGVGGDVPQPIPRLDPLGRRVGVWSSAEVAQRSPRDPQGRGAGGGAAVGAGGAAIVGATPGLEHRSAVRDAYLRRLAGETGLRYVRLDAGPQTLLQAWTDPAIAHPVAGRWSLRPIALLLALAALVMPPTRSILWRLRPGASRRRLA